MTVAQAGDGIQEERVTVGRTWVRVIGVNLTPKRRWKMIRHIFFRQFALSAFSGLLFFDIFFSHLGGDFQNAANGVISPMSALAAFTVTGLCVALLTWIVQTTWKRREEHMARLEAVYGDRSAYLQTQVWIAFFSGCIVLPVLLLPRTVFLLTFILMTLAYLHLRLFARRIKGLMQPGHYATWADVGEMLLVYMTMLAVFTLLMASVSVIHSMVPDIGAPLNLNVATPRFLDFVYFSVVVMTTLGFGDISPATYDAKILVAIQCLISYFMFALMVGLMTKGILLKGRTED